jgi:hypothetical protein
MDGDEVFIARATNFKIFKNQVGVQCECMNSLPRGIRWLVRKTQEGINDQAKKFIDFEQGLDWTFGMDGNEVKRQNAKRPTQVG